MNNYPQKSNIFIDRYFDPKTKSRITTLTCFKCQAMGTITDEVCPLCDGSGVLLLKEQRLISSEDQNPYVKNSQEGWEL